MEQASTRNDQKTILVVDDDEDILSFVYTLLADGNYNVFTARNGSEALQPSRDYKGPVHLLLTDLQMPGCPV